MRISFRPEATADLTEAYRWYERQRRGLGAEFETAVEGTLGFLKQAPLPSPCSIGRCGVSCSSGSPTPSTTGLSRTRSRSARASTHAGTRAAGADGRDA
jgi:hypothetical protein